MIRSICQRIMSSSSVLVVNFVGYVDGEDAQDTRIVLNTLRSVFAYVVCASGLKVWTETGWDESAQTRIVLTTLPHVWCMQVVDCVDLK